MFTAEKACKLTCKAKEGRVSEWQQIQFQIRRAAIVGINHIFISDEYATQFITALTTFGYKVKFNPRIQLWTVSWGA